MVLLVHPVAGALGMHGVAVQHAALADREVGDVDHLLHFAVAFGLALAHFQRDQRTQRILVLAQRLAAQAHGFAAARGRGGAPDLEGFLRARDHEFVVGLAAGMDLGNHLVGGRIDRLQQAGVGGLRPFATAQVGAGIGLAKAECLEDVCGHAVLQERCRKGAARRAPAERRF